MHSCCHCGKKCKPNEMQELPADEDGLNQWSEHYNLHLKIKSASSKNFVCKEHLNDEIQDDEVAMESVSETVENTIEEAAPMQVKVEEEGMWHEPKEEPLDDVFDQFPFETEADSFADYDGDSSPGQLEKYEEEQPTTSTRNMHPEVSDTQILSLCVKQTTPLSGDVHIICGMCPGKFDSLDALSIRQHMCQNHPLIMNEFASGATFSQIPKIRSVLHSSTKTEADKALCRFLIANGVSLRAVNDRNLDALAFNLNSNYKLPSFDTLFRYATGIAEARLNTAIEKYDEDSPVTVTFDTTTFNNVTYLAFTVTYYRMKNEFKKCLFLREFEQTLPLVPSIISTIKQTVEDTDSITSIVTGIPEFEDALDNMGCFQQVMVCFSQNMNRFCEELIRHPVFAVPLTKLREFIKNFPANRNVWASFKAYIVKRRTYGEYPEIDDGHWGTTLDFIMKCLHMHRVFSDFACRHQQIKYIDVDDNINMVYLHSLLGTCKSTIKEMVHTNASIASVIPTVIEIRESIKITTSRPEVVEQVNAIFCRYLLPFAEQSDVHRFAVYVHPFHHATNLLTNHEWMRIERSLATHLATREPMASNQLGNSSAMRQTVSADNEVVTFAEFMAKNPVTAVGVMDFWNMHEKRFPRLYKYARELFQIPAFSVDAAHYLGEYGLLTNALQDLDRAQKKTMLQASSELMAIQLKGELMSRPICVKRKRDASFPEDAWYYPIDQRMLSSEIPIRPVVGARAPYPSQKINNQIVQANVFRRSQGHVEPPPTPLTQRYTHKQKKYCLGPVPRVPPKEVKVEVPEVKTEEPILPKTMKKYYTVRSSAPNGRNLIPAVNPASRFLTGASSARPYIVRSVAAADPGAPPAKKMYFVRPKTGPQATTPQLPPK